MHAYQILCIFTKSILLFFSVALLSVNAHTQPKPIRSEKEGIILSVYGSNTIGTELLPSWSVAYLTVLGLSDVAVVKHDIENEYIVSGTAQGKTYSIYIAARGSGTGFMAMYAGIADIAMSSRKINAAETELLKKFGDMTSPSAEYIVAMDGLAIIVNKKNPLAQLSTTQISQIFSGKITQWSELGGAEKKINIYARNKSAGIWDTLKSLALSREYLLANAAKYFESNDDLSDAVATDEAGIGFVGISSVRSSKALGISTGALPALTPTALHIETEDYSLSRRMFLYTPEKGASPRALDFIEFTQQEEQQTMVKDLGFVSLNPLLIKPKINSDDAPESYKRFAGAAERISINIRFREGSAALDNRSLRDIQRIAKFLKRPENRDKHIQLIGFSNLASQEGRSLVMSKLRASTVQSALHKQQISTLPVAGFGSSMRIASGNSHSKNGRVEVWLIDKHLSGKFNFKHNTPLEEKVTTEDGASP